MVATLSMQRLYWAESRATVVHDFKASLELPQLERGNLRENYLRTY